MNKSVFQHQCSQVAEIFSTASVSSKVLIVALDFAKDKHLGLLCNGQGDQLLKPFTVHNNRKGLDYLLERIRATCQRHALDPRHVIIGGEDCPSYALNLLWALHQLKFCVVRVNAWKSKKQRENVQASTDKIDLLGVAKTLINRDAYLVFNTDRQDSGDQMRDYEAIRELGRTRDALRNSREGSSFGARERRHGAPAFWIDSADLNTRSDSFGQTHELSHRLFYQ